MAGAISATAIRIADLIKEEADFLSSVNDKLKQLQTQLSMMLSFLRDAANLQHQPHRVQNWVAEIRDLVYEAEDVIDTFLVKVTVKRTSQRKCGFTNNGFSNCCWTETHLHQKCRFIKSDFSNFCRKNKDLHQIGTRIITIKDRIADISANLQIHGIRSIDEGEGSSSPNLMRELRRSYPHIEEKQVIGFDAITIDVERQLMIKDEQLRVVSIVGMGGLGKTTLAKKVYNHSHVMQHFDCCSWVFVSQQFSLKGALVGILTDVEFSNHTPNSENGEYEFELAKMEEKQQFKSNMERMKEEDLVKRLHTVLKHKHYLVVLDDIWTSKVWKCLKPAFPNGKKGSKVLFTTRNKEIASFADPQSPLIEPSLLTNDEGWELLKEKALLEDGYPEELKELGRDMVKKCEGLPLAIVILGGLLATKKSSEEWKKVSRNLNAHFIKMQHGQQYDGVHGVLALSYHDLPFHLKPCFLSLSHFPEDSKIHKKTLIRLWIAEGFISQPQAGEANRTMEDIGEEYLEELINRCMLEVSEKDYSRIAPKTCHLHDLVRDMCISRAMDENFLRILKHRENAETSSSSSTVHSATSKSRRIAIHPRIFEPQRKERIYVPLLKGGDPCLRSLFYYVEPYKYQMSKQQTTFILKNFKLLRVLIIDYICQYEVKNIPREIGKLIHLRYLGLRCVGLEDKTKCISLLGSSSPLPTTIGNLRSLCTLDLRWNWNINLPKVFHKLECLRHLLVHGGHGDLQLHNMENLETLKKVRAKTLIRNNALLKFPNLRNLGVVFEDDEVMVLQDYPLRILDISNKSKSSVPIQQLSRYHDLIKLKIEGAISDSLECLPTSLAKLILRRSELSEEDVMKKLEKLPNLRFLHLGFRSYKGSKMVCSSNGFPRLEKLELHGLLELKEWEIEEGAMPCLNTLCLGYLKELQMIPEGLKFIPTLKEVKLVAMKAEFEKRVQVIDGEEGQDFPKVKHIPSIIIQQR